MSKNIPRKEQYFMANSHIILAHRYIYYSAFYASHHFPLIWNGKSFRIYFGRFTLLKSKFLEKKILAGKKYLAKE
jgi:hypothetical protein